MNVLSQIVGWAMIVGWAFMVLFGYAMILAGGFDDEGKIERGIQVAMFSALHTMVCVYLPLYVAIN
jgi:hypothetical protein